MNPVEEFLSTWKRRKSGELPPVDLMVSCVKCSREMFGDDRVDLTPEGLICSDCYKGRSGDLFLQFRLH